MGMSPFYNYRLHPLALKHVTLKVGFKTRQHALAKLGWCVFRPQESDRACTQLNKALYSAISAVLNVQRSGGEAIYLRGVQSHHVLHGDLPLALAQPERALQAHDLLFLQPTWLKNITALPSTSGLVGCNRDSLSA